MTAPCVFISLPVYRQRQQGLAWKQDTSAPHAPGRGQGRQGACPCPLRHAFPGRANSPMGLGAAGPRVGLGFALCFRPRVFMASIEENWNNPLKTVPLEVPLEVVKAESWEGFLPHCPGCTP